MAEKQPWSFNDLDRSTFFVESESRVLSLETVPAKKRQDWRGSHLYYCPSSGTQSQEHRRNPQYWFV